MKSTIYIPADETKVIDSAVNWSEGDSPALRLDEDDTITYTALFKDGMFADIKCCGVQYEEGNDNSAWCEAVLFNADGYEVACTDVEEDFFGTWELLNGNEIYTVYVEREEK